MVLLSVLSNILASLEPFSRVSVNTLSEMYISSEFVYFYQDLIEICDYLHFFH